jgi:hypothetical protein
VDDFVVVIPARTEEKTGDLGRGEGLADTTRIMAALVIWLGL